MLIIPRPLGGGIKRSIVCLSRTGLKVENREAYTKTKILAEVAHVTCDSDTTFKVKGQGHRGGAYCGGIPHSLFCIG